jgi:predicted ATPase/signal transduction histidine kinase
MEWGSEVELIGEVHRGRRFVVARGRRRGDGSLVVMKGVRPDCADVPEAVSRLQREYHLLAALGVPGIAQPVTLEEVEGWPVLVLQDAGPRSLEDWLERRALAPERFLPLARTLAETLARLHARQIIHRDVSPHNVVIDASERPTIVDFDGAVSLAGNLGGVTPQLESVTAYTAPEATGRMSRLVDERADLYSLGAVFYELLTGLPPFSAADPVELVYAHLAREPVPPRQLNPAVPPLLSDLVLKLLAKMPEKRYQSAEALAADLVEATTRLTSTGSIAPFELGLLDLSRELPLPDRLYQREDQLSALRAAWQRARQGQRTLVALAGPAGIGKSALARALCTELIDVGVQLLSGKFEQHQNHTPYSAFVEAIRQHVRGRLAGSPAELQSWRARLREALGANARVISELCPELDQLLGETAPVVPLGLTETETRFRLTVQAFLIALAGSDGALLIFLDDLQWADAASARLLRHLATEAPRPHLLLVVAYRTEAGELPAGPLALLAEVEASGTPVVRIEVPLLDGLGLTAMVGDLLGCDDERARPLAQLVLRKTGGNPFFVRQLLRHLHGSELLSHEGDPGRWTWDLSRVEKVEVADNVVDLLLGALARLPPDARQVLTAASCVGRRIPVDVVAAVCGVSPETAGQALWAAAGLGLLTSSPGEKAVSFEFAHDRVQQAAHSLLSPSEREVLHRKVGQLLLERSSERQLDEQIFTVTDHLHLAAALLTEPAERLALAILDLHAARKAKRSSAHAAASAYLQRGRALLPADAWQRHRELTLALHQEAAESAYVNDDPTLGRRLLEDTLGHVDSATDKAGLYLVCVKACVTAGQREESLRLSREGLLLLGVELPDSETDPLIAEELAAIDHNLAGRSPADLLLAPALNDPPVEATLALLAAAVLVAFGMRPGLATFIIARRVNLCLQHGMCALSGRVFVEYAGLLQRMRGDYALAHAFGRTGVQLAQRYGDAAEIARSTLVFATVISAWREPFRDTLEQLKQAQRQAFDLGDLFFVVGAGVSRVIFMFHQGVELPRLLIEIDHEMALASQSKVQMDPQRLITYRRVVQRLQEMPGAEQPGLPQRHENILLPVAYLLGDLEQARALSLYFGERLRSVTRSVELVDHNFFTSLTLAAQLDNAPAAERPDLLNAIAVNQQQLGVWAELCPENYAHKHLLVAAELARLQGRGLEAETLYEQAIEAANRGQFLLDEALASELAGRFQRRLGRKRTSAWLLSSAVELYRRWGARAKVRALQSEFSDVVSLDPSGRSASLGSAGEEAGTALDRMSLLRAAETISGEVELERLLNTLMEICLTTAGAVRGALVIEEQGEPFIRAIGSLSETVSLQRTALAASDRVPGAIIEHVRRTREALVLADAARHPTFGSDRYVAAEETRSILALPILRLGKLVGVLYLENDLTTRAFAPERIRVLQVLSSHIAVSLENSLLFEKLTREVEERQRAEARVRFLAESSALLAQSLDFETTLTKIAHLALPFLADWCTIDLHEEGQVRRVVAAHRDPEKEKILLEVRRRLAGLGPPSPSVEAIRTGESHLEHDVSDQRLSQLVPDPEARELLLQVGCRSGMTVPFGTGGQPFGAISFVSGSPDRRYGKEDYALAEALAHRAAMAIDNARLYREAREAVRLRDEFLSVASHELNTPIAALTLSIRGMQDALSGKPASQEEVDGLLRLSDRQCRRLRRLIGDLLDITRLERGLLRLERTEMDLAALVREAVTSMAAALERSGCTLSVEASSPVLGRWDPLRLEQVVVNLLSNAAKFGAGKPIHLRIDRDGDTAVLSVKDHGIGIEKAVGPRIFSRFARAASADHYGGLGLGLYISRQLVQAHGGTIDVQSEPGAGATFVVTLPLR